MVWVKRSRQESLLRAEQPWRMRWGAFQSCVAAKAVATFLRVGRRKLTTATRVQHFDRRIFQQC